MRCGSLSGNISRNRNGSGKHDVHPIGITAANTQLSVIPKIATTLDVHCFKTEYVSDRIFRRPQTTM